MTAATTVLLVTVNTHGTISGEKVKRLSAMCLPLKTNIEPFFRSSLCSNVKGFRSSFERVQWLISTYLEQKQTDKQLNITVDLIRFTSEVT